MGSHMLDCLFSLSRRWLWTYSCVVTLALFAVPSVPASAMAAGKSIFDNDEPQDSAEKPAGENKSSPRPADVPAPSPQPAEASAPAPAISPTSGLPGGSAPSESLLPIPSPANISRSTKLLKELFKSEFADHTAAGRRALAAMMMKNVDKNADDPSAQYVLLSQGAIWVHRPGTSLRSRKPTAKWPNDFASQPEPRRKLGWRL